MLAYNFLGLSWLLICIDLWKCWWFWKVLKSHVVKCTYVIPWTFKVIPAKLMIIITSLFVSLSLRRPPEHNPFYSSIDSMPELKLARRKSIPLVSDLVRIQKTFTMSLTSNAFLKIMAAMRHCTVFKFHWDVLFKNQKEAIERKCTASQNM